MAMTETAPNASGYKSFSIGGFTFERDEYFVTIHWPTGNHQMAIDQWLRCIQRDVAWGFFYGIVNFDHVFGTMNHYGNVDMFAGRFNDAYRKAEVDYNENFDHDDLLECFKAMLSDWTNEGYDPFAAPMETGSPYGSNNGSNDDAVTRRRVVAAVRLEPECRAIVAIAPGRVAASMAFPMQPARRHRQVRPQA